MKFYEMRMFAFGNMPSAVVLVLIAAFAAGHAAVLRNGPFVSVNIVDALWNYVGQTPNNGTHSRNIMEAACSRGFNFVRFAATAYWPLNMRQLYYAQESLWWERFDTLVSDAAAVNCTLMPSFLWNPFVFSDVANEPFQALFDPSSQSRALLFDFVKKTVVRYATSNTIIAWELWNEVTNMADENLTGSTIFCATQMGTPSSRTSRDNCSSDDLIGLQRDLAALVRLNDRQLRPINSGNDIPRACAEHLRASYHKPQRDYTLDTESEFQKNLIDMNQHADWMCIHLYAGENVRWNFTDPDGAGLLTIAQQAAQAAKKSLYLGEFGDPQPGPRTFSRNVLDVLKSANIPLATIWIWEFYQASPTQPSDFSLIPGRDDDFIETMQRFNN